MCSENLKGTRLIAWGIGKDFMKKITVELDFKSEQFPRVKERHFKYWEQHVCNKYEAKINLEDGTFSHG